MILLGQRISQSFVALVPGIKCCQLRLLRQQGEDIVGRKGWVGRIESLINSLYQFKVGRLIDSRAGGPAKASAAVRR